ncbi:jg1899 [Pararge aegeria aegeria]|uniref:Jg1899 protein n=1 Tax=Pararge aegeria aegeria TaxID=348720 RepID=A0A8S4QU15_9NEOP|nr:jg1899 [Pararge aegeria aegeria]
MALIRPQRHCARVVKDLQNRDNTTANGRRKYLFTTRLSPNKAKYFFPCFDNPLFEAVFKFKVYVTSTHPSLQYCNTSLVIAEELKRQSIVTMLCSSVKGVVGSVITGT